MVVLLLLLVMVVLLVVMLLRLRVDLGPDIGDLLWEWWWGWEMSAFGLETVLVGGVVDGDWGAVRGGVAVVALGDLDLSVFHSSVLDVSLLLSADAVSSLVGVLV